MTRLTLTAQLAATAALMAFGSAAMAERNLSFELGLGAKSAPAYFGASESVWSPTGTLSFAGPEKRGFSVQGAFRFIGARDSSEYADLTGLPDVDPALELGVGLSYDADSYRVFADIRQGFGGHDAQVAEIGADLKFGSSDTLSVAFGPRALFATSPYFDSYFAVSSTAAAASGLAPYEGGSGLVSTGAHLSARYQINDDWAVLGTLDHTVLQGDAADSPIVKAGDAQQTSVSVMMARKFSFSF